MDDAALTELKHHGGTLGASTRWASANADERKVATEPARSAMTAQFAEVVDRLFPELSDDTAERERKIKYLQSAYFADMRIEALRRKREAEQPARGQRVMRVAKELFGEE